MDLGCILIAGWNYRMYLFTIYSVVMWCGEDDLMDSEILEYRRQYEGQGLLVFQDMRLEGSLYSDFFLKCSH